MEKKSLIEKIKDAKSKPRLSVRPNGANKDNIKAIRIIDVSMEAYKAYGQDYYNLGKSYGVTSPYALPENMTLDEACYIVSALYNEIKRSYRHGAEIMLTKRETEKVEQGLKNLGFEELQGYNKGYLHTVDRDYNDGDVIRPSVSIPQDADVADLFRIGGKSEYYFKRSSLYGRYFEWYDSKANTNGVNKIISALHKDKESSR